MLNTLQRTSKSIVMRNTEKNKQSAVKSGYTVIFESAINMDETGKGFTIKIEKGDMLITDELCGIGLSSFIKKNEGLYVIVHKDALLSFKEWPVTIVNITPNDLPQINSNDTVLFIREITKRRYKLDVDSISDFADIVKRGSNARYVVKYKS